MNELPGSVLIATIGGQPQVITLTLDALLAQGETIDEVIVVHLADDTPRYREALRQLAAEFVGECYRGRRVRYRTLPVMHGLQPVGELHTAVAADAVLDTFYHLLPPLKLQRRAVHLCPTGGRRLLGMLALTAAQLYLEKTDRVWHLYSSDNVRTASDRGMQMHLPSHPEVRLVPVPVQPWGQMLPWLRPGSNGTADASLRERQRMIDETEHTRCTQVYDRLTPRQLDVLRAFTEGKDPQDAAAHLCISVGTVHAHKKVIFEECLNAWDLPPDTHLSYHWLRARFSEFIEQL